MNLQQLGAIALSRRIQLGLNQTQLGKLVGLSRATIGLLELGQLNDMGMIKAAKLMTVIGIEFKGYEARSIDLKTITTTCAAINENAKVKITPEALIDSLVTGEISQNNLQNLKFFITTLPSEQLVSTIEAVALKKNIKPRKIWMTIKKWSLNFDWNFMR